MRYILFLIYTILIMLFIQFCGDPIQANSLLDAKAANTAQMADAYTKLYHAEAQGDVAGMNRYRQEILRLGEENRELHRNYPSKRNNDDDDDFGNTIDEFRAMNNKTAGESEQEKDNLAQQIIRTIWFGGIVRFCLWLLSALKWLLGWIPLVGPLVVLVLILVAVVVMFLGYLVPGIIPLILVSL